MGSRENYIEKIQKVSKSIISKGYDTLKSDFNEIYLSKKDSVASKHEDISVEESLLNFNEKSKIFTSENIRKIYICEFRIKKIRLKKKI